MSNLFVNKFGGVIVHLKDGSSKHLLYGDQVPVDELAEHVEPDTFADSKTRHGHASDDPVRAAHNRAAHDHVSPGSSASPVPGNYEQLSEDEAALFVQTLSNDSKSQAAVLVHERLNAGARQAVIDASTSVAQAIADAQISADVVHSRVSDEIGPPVAADPDPQGPNAYTNLSDVPTPAPASKSKSSKSSSSKSDAE